MIDLDFLINDGNAIPRAIIDEKIIQKGIEYQPNQNQLQIIV